VVDELYLLGWKKCIFELVFDELPFISVVQTLWKLFVKIVLRKVFFINYIDQLSVP
jgi:hypothetical protein